MRDYDLVKYDLLKYIMLILLNDFSLKYLGEHPGYFAACFYSTTNSEHDNS